MKRLVPSILVLAGCNAVPGPPLVSVEPREPTTVDPLVAIIVGDAYDPNERDTLTYRFTWTRDGEAVAVDGDTVDPALTRRFERWEVTVTADDGHGEGQGTSASVVVLNHPPSLASVAIVPAALSASEPARCIPQGWEDPDGDPEDYRWRWSVNGVDVAETEEIPGSLFGQDDEVYCAATPWDGYVEGTPVVSSTATLSNTPPTVSGVRIEPGDAGTDDTISCVWDALDDADGDDVAARIAWEIDGSLLAQSTVDLLPGWFERDEAIRCRVTPFDGDEEGQAEWSQVLTIANTPPTLADVAVSPSTIHAGLTLECSWDFQDIDADPDLSTVVWTVNGSDVATTPTLDHGFARGDAVSCTGTANDGTDAGNTASSPEVVAVNAPPPAPPVDLAHGTGGSPLSCTVTADLPDADGDTLTYDFTWYENFVEYNGGTINALSATVPGSAVQSGETWVCRVVAFDGVEWGAASTPLVVIP